MPNRSSTGSTICFGKHFCASDYSPDYAPLTPGRSDLDEAGAGVQRLEIPETLKHDGQKGAYEADQIARSIRSAIDNQQPVVRTSEEKASGIPEHAVASDFLIITRDRKPTTIYADALRRYGLPTGVTGGHVLNQVPELQLLHLCLVAVTRCDDSIALTALLRSELFGVDDATLYDVVRSGGRLHYQLPLPDELDGASYNRLAPIMDRLQRFSVLLRQLPTVTAIGQIAADLGLPARACAQEDGSSRAGSLLKAIELLRTTPDLVSVDDFVNAIGRMVDQTDPHDGVSVRPPIESPVRVMNLHQCKGLESTFVFLAYPAGRKDHPVKLHIDRSHTTPRGYLAINGWQRSKYGPSPLLAHPAGWSEKAEEEQRFLNAEDKRLMYVAATRCRQQLVVAHHAKQNNRSPWSALQSNLESVDEFPEAESIAVAPSAPIKLGDDWDTAVRNVDQRWQHVVQPTYATQAIKATAIIVDDKPYGDQADGMAWGNVVHQLFEVIMNQDDEPDLEPLALSLLSQEQLETSSLNDLIDTVTTVKRSEIWKRARAADERLTEVPIAWLTDDDLPTITRGVIDLAFRKGDHWVIVDYKSERIDESQAEALAAYYRPQLQAYVAAWEKLTGEQVGESGILLTHTGQFVQDP